ncbi:hypothetical protein HIM_01780 [Hirsutella minnesotensis 3608]|nr:hypothetical protein HIM_01780 [Hirsutella minnesotensis 3608]
MSQGHLDTYRFCDDVWTFLIRGMVWKMDADVIQADRVKIVCCKSPNATPSPDGRYIASFRSPVLSVRSAKSLRLVNVVTLASRSGGPVSAFLWAPSSTRILVAIDDQIHILSATDSSFHASLQNPAFAEKKPAAVFFGSRDTEIFACSVFGLKFYISDLLTERVVEISNPKFHHPSTASRGFCLRAVTGHLALLTRADGKDFVSLHCPETRQVQRSWIPDTVDAQGLTWTPDGQWLILWDSPAHGHRLLLFTPDGQHFRTLDASCFGNGQGTCSDPALELGIRICQASPDSARCAVGDHGRTVTIIDTQSWRESMRLIHPATIVPRDTIQVWQEQLLSGTKSSASFLRATMTVEPPALASDVKSMRPAGCSQVDFDASSTLLATRLDDSPATLWIWDLAAAELRAVLIFHSHVSFKWHPITRETLLITCRDEARRGASFVWDPLSDGPRSVSPADYLPTAKAESRPQASWLNGDFEFPRLLITDGEDYVILSLDEDEDGPGPWQEQAIDDECTMVGTNDTSTLDDTFSFKNP